MKRAAVVVLILLGLGVIAARSRPARKPADAPLRVAPSIELTSWINAKPIKPRELKGTVRVIEFWAFGNAPSQNTASAMRELHARYGSRGVRVLGIHTPEFPRERDSVAVAAAVRKQGLAFPVGLDPERKAFDSFKNRRWPALYLVDRRGMIAARHLGELQVDTRAWRNWCAAIDSALVMRETAKRR